MSPRSSRRASLPISPTRRIAPAPSFSKPPSAISKPSSDSAFARMKSFALNASKKTKSTPAGEIPVDWAYLRLEEVAAIQTGLSKSEQRQGKTVKMDYLRVANVQDGHFDLSEVKQIAVPIDAVERFRVRAGDVLLTEGVGFRQTRTRCSSGGSQLRDCVHPNHFFVCVPSKRPRRQVPRLSNPEFARPAPISNRAQSNPPISQASIRLSSGCSQQLCRLLPSSERLQLSYPLGTRRWKNSTP